MFGYVVANQANLTPEQAQRYRAAYCGLCRTIGQRHGQPARLTLTYDMTFLLLLLDSLYEPEQAQGVCRCPPHPIRAQHWRASRYTEYAADLNVALAYYNCLDDWRDDHNAAKWAAAKALAGRYRAVQSQWPEQCRAIEEGLSHLSRLEQAESAALDEAARSFGGILAALFAVRDDRWADTLRETGNKLGQFIYLMDAVLDREADEKRGRYNPVSAFERAHGPFQAPQALTMLIGDCTLAFERLPLEQDLDLLRNILYSGVWARYAIAQQRKARTSHKGEHTT